MILLKSYPYKTLSISKLRQRRNVFQIEAAILYARIRMYVAKRSDAKSASGLFALSTKLAVHIVTGTNIIIFQE